MNADTKLRQKVILITGGNRGIGYETALALAFTGAKILLACRDLLSAEVARTQIISKTGNYDIVIYQVNLASLKSVRELAENILNNEKRLDILINNAGLTGHSNTFTDDGLNFIMQTNYFGHFLLTNLLLDLLKKSAPSRIVNVSSIVAELSYLTAENLNNPGTSINNTTAYNNSKLANIVFSNELARRLHNTGVTSNALHPGVVNTNALTGFLTSPIMFFVRPFSLTAEKGAKTSVYAAVSDDMEGITGKYLKNCKIARMPEKARDTEFVRKIWEKTEELVKLCNEDTKL